jgi:uncharacterized protein involved in exopolysaccharide biosynthesis
MGPIQTLEDVIDMVRRRFAVIVAVTVVGVAATLWHAINIPRTYEAVAVIQITLPRVTGDLARGGEFTPVSQRIQQIEQRLLLRESMLEIIRQHGLFADAPAMTDSDRIVALRQSITLQPISAAAVSRDGLDVSGLIVVARLGDPLVAAAVANELAGRITRLGTEGQQARFDETLAFLRDEERRVSAEVTALEREITAYKDANLESLPESLSALRQEMAVIDTTLRDLERERIELASEREELAEVRNLRAVQQRRLEQIDAGLRLIADQVASLDTRKAQITDAIRRSPSVEMVLSTYERRRQQLTEEYGAVARRLAEAETARRLAENESIERFALVEQAVPPDYAMQSGRRRVAILGAAVSAMIGFAAAVALELRNPVLRTAGQMQRMLDIRPVVTIPYIPTSGELQRRKAIRFAGIGLALLLLVFGAAAFALSPGPGGAGFAAASERVEEGLHPVHRL